MTFDEKFEQIIKVIELFNKSRFLKIRYGSMGCTVLSKSCSCDLSFDRHLNFIFFILSSYVINEIGNEQIDFSFSISGNSKIDINTDNLCNGEIARILVSNDKYMSEYSMTFFN